MRCHPEQVDPTARTSITNSTYSRRSKTVSTVKKSTATTPAAWACRTCRHETAGRLGAGATPARCRIVHTVLAPTLPLYPRRHSSPWIRRYPRSGSPWPAAAPARGPPSPRPAGPAGAVGPAASDQVPMPTQQRRRLDEQAPPGRTGQQPRQPSQHRPVGPVDPRPGHLASQHRHLVAQHEQLGVLCRRTPRQQHKPPQHLAEQQIEQSKSHVPIIAARQLRWRTRSSAATTDLLAPTSCVPHHIATAHRPMRRK
jgi:hypothetical protein